MKRRNPAGRPGIPLRDDPGPENAAGASPEARDAALVARLRAGDDAAYRELVVAYGGRLLAVSRRFLRHEDDARDAVQDAFLQAWKALPRFQGECLVSTWLHRIVVNASLMKLRRRKSRREESIEPLLPTFKEDGHASQPSVEWPESADRLVERNEVRALVRGAIDRLPESYRTVLLLRDLEERTTQDAARLLGVTENAVKIRLHRARQALRELLDRELRERKGATP
ncbi:MAG: sigma-70 family RNA polymerase sigma factor [Thermoanaerobaculia bacterium]